MLTTGGGWQDQCGGLFPGVKLSESSKDHTQLAVSTEVLSKLQILSFRANLFICS